MASNTSENWQAMTMDHCHQTARDGGFFSDIRRARRHFEKQGWRIIEDEWWCPCCVKTLTGE